MKPLDITLQSQLNQIFDPESQVKSSISQKYNLSASEVAGLRVKITNVNIGVGSMIDDHAISSYVVTPQISSS
jgi:hypothetical protein